MNDVTQADQVQPQASIKPVQPVQNPVGSVNKEVGPVSSAMSELRPAGSEVSHEISQELRDIGVEEKQDRPDLTDEHKELGVNHAGPHVPVPTRHSGKVKLPMSEEEIESKLRTGQDDDSGKWLAGLVKKVIKVMGL
jgi:hypothetical protein